MGNNNYGFYRLIIRVSCNIGKENIVRLGEYPWISCKGNYKLSQAPLRDMKFI